MFKFFAVVLSFLFIQFAIAQTSQFTQFVDPFIGTEGAGNTFPGATLPFGMVKLGPDCGHKRSNSGYIPNEVIHGFSHTHVSGTGGGAKYGNILLMPFNETSDDFKISMMPSNLEAKPGYFSVHFNNDGIHTEMTVTHSVGFHNIQFEKGQTKGILLDVSSFLGKDHCCEEAQELVDCQITWVTEQRIEGFSRVRGGWNKGEAYTVYFSAVFNQEMTDFEFWQEGKPIKQVPFVYGKKEKTGVKLYFDKDVKDLKVKVGISFLSTEKAYLNIQNEIPHWDFDEVKMRANSIWNQELNKIKISTQNQDYKTIFYTALYHTLLMPTDRTGENPKWTNDQPYYDDFYAIWDTYRATNPLLLLITPKREMEIIQSLLDIYANEGYMPDARSGNSTGRTQGGSNCDMVVAEAYLKGFEDFDLEKAYEALTYDAEVPAGGNQQKWGRGGLMPYIELGYVSSAYEPQDESPTLSTPQLYDRAGTRTVEFAANDYAIALMAKKMGKADDYIKYKKRASNWANLWNNKVESEEVKGFIWPRQKDGNWVKDFNVNKGGSWGNFFYEADSWEYSFYVPQDVAALIDSCGGQEKFIKRLDIFFENDHYQVSNEPSFFTPCLYTYAGRQDKTNKRIRTIINENYTAKRDGIPGNDDAGSMSAWVIFNMMGFYPNAGQDVYIITSPHFENVHLNLGNGKFLKIKTHHLSSKNIYIDKVVLNGKTWDKAWFQHKDIKEGGLLEFYMTDEPKFIGENNLPPSLSDED